MTEWIAFLLPPAVALMGMRLIRLVLGSVAEGSFNMGIRFALGLSVGMLVTTQIVLWGTLAGLKLSSLLSSVAFLWGTVELLLLLWRVMKNRPRLQIRRAHAWLLLLLPLVWFFWAFGRLSVVEGAMEFDGVTYWLFKAKVIYLKSGADFLQVCHTSRLAYAHWDYPLLVPALYTLSYGAVGDVNEFIVKPWPFWMVLSLSLAILSLGDVWRRPRPLPIASVLLVCLLPGTLHYIHREGGTVPMLFHAGLATLLILRGWMRNEPHTLAAAVIVLAGCAMTKFEGIIYAGLWACLLLPLGWRRGWLRNPLVLRALALSLICILPYLGFRLEKPVQHPESAWIKAALNSPGTALERFPALAGVGLTRCFLNRDFASWTAAPDGRLQWTGTWQWLGTPSHYLLHGLPLLTLILLWLSLGQKEKRWPVLALTGAVFGVFFILAFVLACLAQLFPQDNVATYVIAKTGDDMNRYAYPFLLSWFLGIVSIWFTGETAPDVSPTSAPHPAG